MTAPTISPPADHSCHGYHLASVGGGTDTRPASDPMETTPPTLAGADTHPTRELTATNLGASDGADTGPASGLTATSSPSLARPDLPADHNPVGDHTGYVGGDTDTHLDSQSTATRGAAPGGSPVTAIVGHLAGIVSDLESARIAAENRVRILTRTETDKDGVLRGWGLTEEDVPELVAVRDALAGLEKQTVRSLERVFRRHPLATWQKAATGVGAKQLSRLLLTLGGDPYWHPVHNRPRTRAELRAYCGMHVVDGRAPTKARGQRVTWSPEARIRIHLIAESAMKNRQSPYRAVYETARAHYDGLPHPMPCVRCGPAGSPAAAGTPRSAGHAHANGLRAIARAILDDLWEAARRVHEEQP